jgi:branched-chain amino acid transport system substrate-binding protein
LYLDAALNAVKGKFEDKPAFIKALHDVRLEKSPMGPIRIDKYGKPILTVYVRKVERKEGKLVNSIVATFPEVSQFWTFDQAKFLAAPVYSRDYPPAKNLE